MVLLVIAATASDLTLLLVMAAGVLAVSLADRHERRSLVVASKATLGLGLVVLPLQGVWHAEGEVISQLGPVALYQGGLQFGAVVVLRLYVITLACLLFFAGTEPGELSHVLVRMGLPYRYAMLAGLALRFLPVLEQELNHIFAAQEARGLELSGPIRKALAFGPVLLPFCLRALCRANEVALAMELRAFGIGPRRTFLDEMVLRRVDYAATFGALLLLAAYTVRYLT